MKTEIMFAVASIMLVGAVIVFALPTPVQADKKTEWCTSSSWSPDPTCFNGKGKCEKFVKENSAGWYTSCTERPA
jgi:hypothetical protein